MPRRHQIRYSGVAVTKVFASKYTTLAAFELMVLCQTARGRARDGRSEDNDGGDDCDGIRMKTHMAR